MMPWTWLRKWFAPPVIVDLTQYVKGQPAPEAAASVIHRFTGTELWRSYRETVIAHEQRMRAMG